MPNRPKSKSGQLSDLIRARIADGEWQTSLPSERRLAEEYFVSRTTLRGALKSLAAEGVIGSPSSTRSGRMVAAPAKRTNPNPAAGQVVILTPSLRESPLLLEHLAVLRELLGNQGTQVHVREAARLAEESDPTVSLRRWAKDAPPTVWILHKMPRSVQQAAAGLKLKAIVFGTVFPGIDLPHVDVDFRAVARHATGRCLARGHRKLAVLVHRTHLAGDSAVIAAVGEELARAGAPPPVILKHDFNRSRLIDTLDHQIVPSAGRPDALLVVNQHHILTALPHLLHRGLRVPRDLSIVYLSNDPAVERLSPLPERYDLGDRLLRRLAKAAQESLAGGHPASAVLLPRLLKGETLA
ncbi:MAG: GntR family transcriptional regulator [Verrucomicrobia bacterium]|nr:GntR family transcriptional regulator [Verrucomicrobiota bacterium]